MLMFAVRLFAMGGRVRGLWPLAVVGAIAVATVAGLAVVWRSSHRADLEGFAGLAISVAGIAAGWIGWIWRVRSQQARGVVSGQELGRLADLLAGAVDAEWTRAAGERGLLEPEPIPVRWQRPAAPFTGPASAAVASTRFAPLPGLAAARERRLQAGQISELHEVYGGLGSGRLVIVGGPGAGKSGAAGLCHRTGMGSGSRSPRSPAARVHSASTAPASKSASRPSSCPVTAPLPCWLLARHSQAIQPAAIPITDMANAAKPSRFAGFGDSPTATRPASVTTAIAPIAANGHKRRTRPLIAPA